MGIYSELYDFAARAGALEGYVYPRSEVDVSYLPGWADHIVEQYHRLPPEAREEIQSLCDDTLGRAVMSLIPLLGEEHEVIKKLKSVRAGKLPGSSDDFGHRR